MLTKEDTFRMTLTQAGCLRSARQVYKEDSSMPSKPQMIIRLVFPNSTYQWLHVKFQTKTKKKVISQMPDKQMRHNM